MTPEQEAQARTDLERLVTTLLAGPAGSDASPKGATSVDESDTVRPDRPDGVNRTRFDYG
jgi:hypothetical protein